MRIVLENVDQDKCADTEYMHAWRFERELCQTLTQTQWQFRSMVFSPSFAHPNCFSYVTWPIDAEWQLEKKRIWPFDIGRKRMKTECILSVRKFNSMIFYRAFWLHQFFFFLEWLLSFKNKTRKFWSFCFVFRLFVCFGLFDWIYFPVYSNMREFPWTKLTKMIWK